MAFVSYAQNCEDVLLWRALGSVERGFYIDVGASDPEIDSVTRAFFDRGWRGINIEPVAEDAARIAAARPGDITLQFALAGSDGEAEFFVVPGTGLSTLDPDVARTYRDPQWDVHPTRVATLTLASLCRKHVRGPIHFLKIDVEGAEADVLAGADLGSWRPWIILVEATAPRSTEPTHAAWEPHLLRHDYRFVWFDGLNRFYVAEEHFDRLSQHFQVPPNVFDGFIKSTDARLAAGLAAEQRAAEAERALAAGLQAAARRVELAIEQAEFARHALIEVRQDLTTSLIECRTDLHFARHELQETHLRLQAALARAQAAQEAGEYARAWLDAVRTSTSWRLTGPLRVVLRQLGRRPAGRNRPALPHALPPPEAAPIAAIQPAVSAPSLPPGFFDVPAAPPAAAAEPGRCRRAVHQFHSGSAVADAITNAMLLTRTVLRQLGYESEIYVTHRAPELAGALRLIGELPLHDDYVLIVRHSMGHDAFAHIVGLPAPKVLIYHNITPPDLLARHPYLAAYAELGRRQLASLPAHVHAALADSAFNAIELRELGFAPVSTCTLLFDADALRADAGRYGNKSAAAPFTVLFVGRICQSKGQLELIAAWREFRALHGREARLVLVGRSDGVEDAYARAVEESARSGPYADEILLTGLISDAERDAWYACASLYVSLSRHEGFGVPLVEAMAHRVAVLARASGAVPYTVDNPACLLPPEADAAHIGRIMHAHAEDPEALAALGASLSASLDRFALPGQAAILQQALLRAGAVLPEPQAARALLDANLHFAVTGHVNKTYSLAAVNRGLVLTLEAARPGTSRLIPVEGVITDDLSGVPGSEAGAIATLAQRAAPLTGPELIISQHYPVHVPPRRAGHGLGQVSVALLFWEESLLPAATIATLEQGFAGVVAPTRFVARALLNSGLRLPVRVIDHAPRLDAFLEVPRADRMQRDVLAFLHVSSCFPRKGVDLLLDAWAASFTAADPVCLTIKSFANPHNQVAEAIETLRARHPDLAPVTLIEADLDEAAMARLYANADVMVLPSRGEGYNLPASEALAAGMRLIVTGAGGHMDFCSAANPLVRLLRWRFAASESHLATPHSLWLQPDRDDLADALREALAQGRGPAGAGRIARRSGNATTDALARFGIDLLLRPPRRKLRIGWISTWNQRCGVAGYSRLLLDALAGDDAGSAHADITVLCDGRTPTHAPDAGSAPHLPCWSLGMEEVGPLLDAIARLDPDVVVMQHQPGLAEWPNLVRLIDGVLAQGRVMTVTLHNSRDLLELPPDLAGAVLDALSRIDRVIVHTVAAMNQLAEQGHRGSHDLADRLVLFPQGSRKPRSPAPPRSLAADDTPIIASTGFFLRGKGIDRLIEAALLLQRDWPRLQLRLVNAAYGADESTTEIERARTAAAALGDRVQFVTEFLAEGELLDRLVDCDIIVLPYRESKEASSAAMRTALTSSVPVAVSQVALFDEAEGAVFRIDATDPVKLAAGIDRLLRDVEQRRQVQGEAQAWMQARAWAPIARRMIGMLDGLAQARF